MEWCAGVSGWCSIYQFTAHLAALHAVDRRVEQGGLLPRTPTPPVLGVGGADVHAQLGGVGDMH